jgi:hypothetical protein
VLLLAAGGGGVTRAQTIYEMQDVETRWASPENPTGEKGRGGRAAGGRKGSPTIPIKAGESVVLAEAKNTSGMGRWRRCSDTAGCGPFGRLQIPQKSYFVELEKVSLTPEITGAHGTSKIKGKLIARPVDRLVRLVPVGTRTRCNPFCPGTS